MSIGGNLRDALEGETDTDGVTKGMLGEEAVVVTAATA